MKQEWFENWFDTTYYHLLYKNRNDQEAAIFMKGLIKELHIKRQSRILDLACGKGRHSLFLNEHGMNVTGVDLSIESIKFAKKNENKNLKFEVHDMRSPFMDTQFDFVFNLFTSFGYFKDPEDNLNVLSAAYEALNKNGMLVLDYFNPTKAISDLVEYEVKSVESVDFNIKKSIKNRKIRKEIEVIDQGNSYSFFEEVDLLYQNDFDLLFKAAGFNLIYTYGDYNLGPFKEKESKRMIFVVQR